MSTRARRVAVATAVLAIGACTESPVMPSSETGIAVEVVDYNPSGAALDAGVVRVTGPTSKVVNAMPGSPVHIDGLLPGSYTVAIQGLVGGLVVNYGQVTGVQVTVGKSTPTTLSFPTFVPVVPAPPPPPPGRAFTVNWAPVANAVSYRIEAATDLSFSTNLVLVTAPGNQTSAQVNAPTYETYHVRVRAIDPYQGNGQWSQTQSVQLAGTASASQSSVTASPGSIVAGATTTITVTARDDGGVPVPGLTVSLSATGTNNSLTQPTGVTNSSGVASGTFGSTKAESKTFSATIAGALVTQTASVTVTPGSVSATQSTVAASPTPLVAGATSTITVTGRDGFANLIQGATVTLAASGTGNTLTQPATATNGSGQTTGSLSSSVAESKAVNATINGTAITQSPSVLFTAGPVDAARSSVSATPASVVASRGGSTASITVTAVDAFSNPVVGATVVLAASGPGNSLSQPPVTNASGVTVGTLSSTGAGDKVISATISGTVVTQTVTINVTAGPVNASLSTVTASPTSIFASNGGSASTITVTARDTFSNPIGGVIVSLSATGAGNTLSQPIATNASGVTTGTVSSTVSGAKTISATISGTLALQTATVTVTNGSLSLTQSTVSAAPTTIAASNGASTSTITVTARDGFSNPIPGVTVSIAASGTGNSLTQPVGPTNANGVATGTLSSTVPEGKTISATISGSVIVQTASVTVTAAASLLVFTQQPTTATAGVGIAPDVQVTARDNLGNTATGFTGNITLAIGSNPGGGSLSGSTVVAAVAGVASFPGVAINRTGTGYTLSATATGLTGATSTTFNITPGVASVLVFTQQPTNATAGVGITPAVQLTARDNQGNTATAFTGNITVAIGSNPSGATLSGTTGVAAIAGVASFPGLSINRTGSYTLTASATGPTGATSAGFNITSGPASALAFTTQPSSATAGVAISPAVVVTARDNQGNTATTFNGTVTVAIGTNPVGGILSGSTTIAAVAGVATFSTLSINRTGTGYTLTASAAGLTGAASAAFSISPGAAAVLAFTVQPTSTLQNVAISPNVVVTARDSLGNTATGFSGNIVMAIGTNPHGGALSGTLTVAAVSGVATFSTLFIFKPAGPQFTASGAGYTLRASSGSITGESQPFDIADVGRRGTATIDGQLSPGEWATSECLTFSATIPEGGTTPAMLCVQNDATNLYLLVRYTRAPDPRSSINFHFDQNQSGNIGAGDDVITFGDPRTSFQDRYWYDNSTNPTCPVGNLCQQQDVAGGGATNGQGAYLNNGTESTLEVSHPLSSGDARDISLAVGQSMAFFLGLAIYDQATSTTFIQTFMPPSNLIRVLAR